MTEAKTPKLEEVVPETTKVEETAGNVVQEAPLKCAIKLAIREDNTLLFNVEGSDANLIHLAGLLEYAKLRINSLWQFPGSTSKEAEGSE